MTAANPPSTPQIPVTDACTRQDRPSEKNTRDATTRVLRDGQHVRGLVSPTLSNKISNFTITSAVTFDCCDSHEPVENEQLSFYLNCVSASFCVFGYTSRVSTRHDYSRYIIRGRRRAK